MSYSDFGTLVRQFIDGGGISFDSIMDQIISAQPMNINPTTIRVNFEYTPTEPPREDIDITNENEDDMYLQRIGYIEVK